MLTKQRPRATGSLAALVLALVMVLSGCSGQAKSVSGGGDGGGDTITIGCAPFAEVIAVSNLWKHILEQQGYTVQLQQLKVATVYQGLTSGEVDVFFGGVPINHKDYWDRFSDGFVAVGQWYDTLLQGLVVPSYTGLQTISDLQGKAGKFHGEIVGIEAGSGLMQQTKQGLQQTYGLSGYQLRDSSTPAMLAALDRAISQHKPIVVTLWQPHWAFERYDLTLLKDPKGVYPKNDVFKVLTSQGFSNNAAVVDQLSRFHLNPKQLQSLELMIHQAGKGNKLDAVRQWSKQNPAVINKWTGNARS